MNEADASRIAGAFRGLRARLVVNQAWVLWRAARLRLAMVLIFSALFWVVLFLLFFEGFQFLGSFVDATEEIVEYLFGIFFLSLLVMLVVSTGIILYTGLFHAREAAFLLATPAPDDRVFAFKFVEAIAFSSWGFLLLGSPLMVAYGITAGAGWFYYAIFLAYLVSFVLIAGSLGAIAALLVANYAPRRPRTVLAIAVGALLVAGVALAMRLAGTPGEALSRDWLDAMLDRLTFSQHALLPSRWMSRGLVRTARGDPGVGGYYLLITTAHAGLAYLIASVAARDLYRRGYSRVQAGRSSRRRLGFYQLDALLHRAFGFIPRPIRLLIFKDLRCFRRDPAQWSQFLIFFGLLAFYFLNIRRLGLGQDEASPYWRNLQGLLNLSVTALILSTFTTRFIFPLLSLEGRNFWVLGLLPLHRASILWGKFAFAAGVSLVATELLVVLSDVMLGLGPWMLGLHVFVVAILCLGLSAISVGLGACLPNLREDDPSKIAAGFGGTLNLLVSLIYIALILAALALPSRYYFATLEANAAWAAVPATRYAGWAALSLVGCLALGIIAVVVPLSLGIRAFERLEL